jgi:hypothetical protein
VDSPAALKRSNSTKLFSVRVKVWMIISVINKNLCPTTSPKKFSLLLSQRRKTIGILFRLKIRMISLILTKTPHIMADKVFSRRNKSL